MYRATHKETGKQYALKRNFVEGSEDLLDRFLEEGRIMKSLNHPEGGPDPGGGNSVHYIVHCYDYFLALDDLWIVLELCEIGDLEADYIIKNEYYVIPQKEVLKALFQLSMGLSHAHSLGIMHRDLKSQNVLLTQAGTLKICDFGLAEDTRPEGHKCNRTKQTYKFNGTKIYMPPEVNDGLVYTSKCDVWCLGHIIHELCTKSPAFFQGENEGDRPFLNRIAEKQQERIPDMWYTRELQELIDQMLHKVPDCRPSAEELIFKVRSLVSAEDLQANIKLNFNRSAGQRALSKLILTQSGSMRHRNSVFIHDIAESLTVEVVKDELDFLYVSTIQVGD